LKDDSDLIYDEDLVEETKKLNIEIKKLRRQLNLANDNMRKYKSVTNAMENLSAIIVAEKSQQEKQLQVIMDNSPDIIFLLDRALNLIMVSQSFLTLTGLPSLGAANSKSFRYVFSKLADESEIEDMERVFRKALETNESQFLDETLYIDTSDEVRNYSANIVPFAYSGDVIVGLLIDFHDITDHIKLEQRTKAALDEARAASKSKSEFLANMSHEIRTPMNAIIGMTHIGASATDIEQKNYSLSKISDASKHLLGVINDILDMSKIEAGKFDLSPAEFDLDKLFQQIANVVNFNLKDKKQKFAIYIDREIPQYLVGDDQRLAQVITNLISNAIKFTPDQGSIKINTYYLGEEDGLSTIKISVTDNGIGISKEQQADLFHAFTQAETHTARKYGGTGLGLPISKNIVELMGGTIWVESEIGEGATFSFTFKARRGETQKQLLCAPKSSLDNLRILVIDEDTSVLKDIKGIIDGFGICCDTAACGQEALRIIDENGPYDIYFVDYELSDIDIIGLTKEIKAGKQQKTDSLVILLSFIEYSDIFDNDVVSGIDKNIKKPMFPSTIVGIINEYLGVTELSHEDEGPGISGIYEGHQILLAEDLDINREIVSILLEPTLLNIDYAKNGREAVDMFTESPDKYEMIFMDLQMPEMDGYEATERIRELGLPNAETIPIIAMTANVFKEDVEHCFDAGMNGHIGKPINIDDVMGVLNEYLHFSSGPSQ